MSPRRPVAASACSGGSKPRLSRCPRPPVPTGFPSGAGQRLPDGPQCTGFSQEGRALTRTLQWTRGCSPVEAQPEVVAPPACVRLAVARCVPCSCPRRQELPLVAAGLSVRSWPHFDAGSPTCSCLSRSLAPTRYGAGSPTYKHSAEPPPLTPPPPPPPE